MRQLKGEVESIRDLLQESMARGRESGEESLKLEAERAKNRS